MQQGAVVKHYELWGPLSEGGMSQVWLARHQELALPVILKTLLPNESEPFATRYERLLQEARLTARLSSPQVVRVLDVGLFPPAHEGAEPVPFFVEEYVDGIDLAEFDARRRRALHRAMPLWAVCNLLAQASEGLHAAHQAGVLHCDVKPSNLFGHGHAHLKVGDFGVAQALHTGRSVGGGTPGFMAPEQLRGEALDRRTDLWALGATGLALRYGRLPYTTLGETALAESPPALPVPHTPEEAYFQHVLTRMLDPIPGQRFATLTEPRVLLSSLAQSLTPRLGAHRVDATSWQVGPVRVHFELGDLSRVETDAIVNSAHSDMQMRRSLGEVLRLAGGDEIEEQALAGGPRALGECVATGAGRLQARGVLHAVGGWREVCCVARAMHRTLLLAEELGYERLALPAIATGRGGVSIEHSADAMVAALRAHVAFGGTRLREVRFVLVDNAVYKRFVEVAVGVLQGGADVRFGDLDEHEKLPRERGAVARGPTMLASSGVSSRAETVQRATEPVREDEGEVG